MINVILQFLELDLVNINVSAKFYQNIPNGLRVKFHFFFQNLSLGKTSTNPKCHLTISWATPLSILMCMQNFFTILHSIKEIGPFPLFQNLALGKASTDDKFYFAIPWARSFQHQIVCKILSKYSKRFKS